MLVEELEVRVGFPVFQDTHSRNIWTSLEGNKDDFFIYDRCGNLAYYLPYPDSWLGYRFFQEYLLSAYNNDPCGCERSQHGAPGESEEAENEGEGENPTQEPSVTADMEDRMMGDSPVTYNRKELEEIRRQRKMERILYNKTVRKHKSRKKSKKHQKLQRNKHKLKKKQHLKEKHHQKLKTKEHHHHHHHHHHHSKHHTKHQEEMPERVHHSLTY
ncbi:selenoprotein Pb-like [Liolophura sinensis]|uniref:selenoprotein Pb-like n=1 Tax=Liolophura sinensis TaxID=3198878 RepID=UPI0031589510